MIERFRILTDKQKGAWGEAFWSNVFHSNGFDYIPLHKASVNGAPMQFGKANLILPDFDVSSAFIRVYADSKYKSHPVLFRKIGQLRHGIDKKNFLHYKEISERNQKHCVLAVFEAFWDEDCRDWSGRLLVQTLARLTRYTEGFSNQSHMVYWPRNHFVELGKLSAEEAQKVTYSHQFPIFKDQLREFLEIRKNDDNQGLLY